MDDLTPLLLTVTAGPGAVGGLIAALVGRRGVSGVAVGVTVGAAAGLVGALSAIMALQKLALEKNVPVGEVLIAASACAGFAAVRLLLWAWQTTVPRSK